MTTKSPRKPKELTLADLRDSQKPLFVKNLTMTTITCNVGTIDFLLTPRGQADSIRILPKEIATAPGFQKVWLKRMVEVSDDPAMEEEITLQILGQTELDVARQRELAAITEENSSAKNLVEKECLISGERVFQTIQQVRDGVPPLAERFQDQASQFISTEVLGPNGPETKFSKIVTTGA